ncbi:MAG: hypothetical protein NVV74_24030 [Magnetospirillum sp.]|nr:hypothetical protein [Magnetospirillum sp.]
MRKTLRLLGAVLVVTAGSAHAALDFSDYDDDLMRSLDKTIKYFEPDIAAKNAARVSEDAELLLEGFKYSEDYFARKGGHPQAVKIAQDGQFHVEAALSAVKNKDFDSAVNSAREAARTCRNCHDIYRSSQK